MRRLLAPALLLGLSGCGMLGGGPKPERAAVVAPSPAAPAQTAAAAAAPISTNAPASTATEVLDDDHIPDAPAPPPPPPDPALFAQAIAPPPIKDAQWTEGETTLTAAQARDRLQQRLTALGFPALTARNEALLSGTALRNPGGFGAFADCSGEGGQARQQAGWVEIRLDDRRKGARVQLSARFEEVRESPVRGVLVRTPCRSLGRLEADLLAVLR